MLLIAGMVSSLLQPCLAAGRVIKGILDYYTYQRDYYPRNYVLIPLRWLKIDSVLNFVQQHHFSRKNFFNCPKFVLFHKLDNYRTRVYICRKVLKSCGMHRNACTNTILLKAAKYVMKFLSKYIFWENLGQP